MVGCCVGVLLFTSFGSFLDSLLGFVVKHRGEDDVSTRRFLLRFHLLTGGERRLRLLHGLTRATRIHNRILVAAPQKYVNT